MQYFTPKLKTEAVEIPVITVFSQLHFLVFRMQSFTSKCNTETVEIAVQNLTDRRKLIHINLITLLDVPITRCNTDTITATA